MSAPSGIKVSNDLKSAFASARGDGSDTRALVFVIESEEFKLHSTVSPKGSFKDDIALLPPTLPTPKTPASFAYRLDSKELGKSEWMMITFVPDDAGVRAKMLQASSRSGLMKALGAANFKHDWFATSLNDLTPHALTAHLNHMSSPPPLSASEAALAEVREAEAAEAKRNALDPQAEERRRRAIVGLGGKFKWGEGVQDALDKVTERSDDGWIVCLEIHANDPGAISLRTSEHCIPSQVSSKLPPKSPCYTFYSYPTPPPPSSTTTAAPAVSSAPRNTFQATQGGVRHVAASSAPIEEISSTQGDKMEEATEDAGNDNSQGQSSPPTDNPAAASTSKGKGRVLFIYSCPSASPIKFRMVYSSGVRGMQQDAMDKVGLDINAKLETSDIADLTESYLRSSLAPSKPTHSSSLPTPSTTSASSSPFGSATPAGGQPTPFGGAFGRPRPMPNKLPIRSATQVPLPPSEISTPVSATPGEEGEDDSKESIRKAFDAFGPRVGAGGAGGFARPRPAGRR